MRSPEVGRKIANMPTNGCNLSLSMAPYNCSRRQTSEKQTMLRLDKGNFKSSGGLYPAEISGSGLQLLDNGNDIGSRP